MSIPAVKAALDHSRSSGTARLVLLALAERAKENPEFGPGQTAFPGARDLARRANVAGIKGHEERGTATVQRWNSAVSSTRRSLKRLKDLGEIEDVRPHPDMQTMVRRLTLPGLEGGNTVLPPGPGEGVTPGAEGVTSRSGGGNEMFAKRNEVLPKPEEPQEGSRKESAHPNTAPPGFFEEKKAQQLQELEEAAARGDTWADAILLSEETAT